MSYGEGTRLSLDKEQLWTAKRSVTDFEREARRKRRNMKSKLVEEYKNNLDYKSGMH